MHRASARDDALVPLGWDDVWMGTFAAQASPHAQPARVVAQHRESWIVTSQGADRVARLAGRWRHAAAGDDSLHPAVGDWVGIEGDANASEADVRDHGECRIVCVLPRRSAFVRKEAGHRTRAQVVAANVDLALVVTALPYDLDLRRLERYLALAWESGAEPLVILSKSDLSDDVGAAIHGVRAAAPGVEVLALSALTGDGVDAVRARLAPTRTAVLLGSSGVGKSTLVNRLLGRVRQRVADVGDDGRGRHTTTHRELLRLPNGALLIDTPGMRELQLWSADAGLEAAFADVESLAGGCRFADCRHDHEPGCAVLEAIADGSLEPRRLEHWRQLGRELAYLARRQDARLESERRARVRTIMREVREVQRRKGRG